LAILGIAVIILRHLPEAAELAGQSAEQPAADIRLMMKGMPAVAISNVKSFLLIWIKKIWNFALEAKDLKPSAAASYKIKKILGNRMPFAKPAISAPVSTDEVKNEKYFLNIIKNNPKNLANYDALGRFYIEQGNTADACDIYEYLVLHDGANADFHARLAFCWYQKKDFGKTAQHYQKSVGLDSSQPNRYYNLGLVLELLGRHGEAATALEQAIALEPQNPKYYLSLCNAYLKLGINDKAINALQKAHSLDPADQNIVNKIDKVKSSVPIKII